MALRHIALNEVEEALDRIEGYSFDRPKGSTQILGTTKRGRKLKIWIVGMKWPPKEPVVIKSVAEKGTAI